jgi:HNH endonuclease
MKRCFRDPIPELFDVARYLDAAISAHLSGHASTAAELFTLANNGEVRAWLESIWGKNSQYVKVARLSQIEVPERVEARMPSQVQISALHKRDGYHCRFCGIPVVRAQVRKRAIELYPLAVTWGRTNISQHAGFQALWAQYDHVVPHSCGGTNDLENLVVTCAACNFGKMSYRLEELGLLDPRDFPAASSSWDGLERLLAHAPNNLSQVTLRDPALQRP